MPKDDDEDGYLLFARPDTNTPVVSSTLDAFLAAQRQSVELTQPFVAQKASISTAHLRAIEKGARQPTISTFLSICEAIEIDPRDLFNRALERMGYPVGFIPVRSAPTSG
jgi:DNA-binding XRE family transcriptional regulator